MDKKALLNLYIEKVTQDFQAALEVAKTAKGEATNSEMKQEGKYDTRAIEAGYLAGAQAKRVKELEADLNLLKNLELKESKIIIVGSVVEVSSLESSKKQTYFISQSRSSMSVTFVDKKITLISIHSPLGNELLGLEEGDEIEVETPSGNIEYQIVRVI